MTYDEAKRAAQQAADESGFDYGVEKLGAEHRFFMLPAKQNRFGFELRCEVVMCTTLARCAKGHGPMAGYVPKKRGRLSIKGERILLDGTNPIGTLRAVVGGFTVTCWPATYTAHHYPTKIRAVRACVSSYLSWVGIAWSHRGI